MASATAERPRPATSWTRTMLMPASASATTTTTASTSATTPAVLSSGFASPSSRRRASTESALGGSSTATPPSSAAPASEADASSVASSSPPKSSASPTTRRRPSLSLSLGLAPNGSPTSPRSPSLTLPGLPPAPASASASASAALSPGGSSSSAANAAASLTWSPVTSLRKSAAAMMRHTPDASGSGTWGAGAGGAPTSPPASSSGLGSPPTAAQAVLSPKPMRPRTSSLVFTRGASVFGSGSGSSFPPVAGAQSTADASGELKKLVVTLTPASPPKMRHSLGVASPTSPQLLVRSPGPGPAPSAATPAAADAKAHSDSFIIGSPTNSGAGGADLDFSDAHGAAPPRGRHAHQRATVAGTPTAPPLAQPSPQTNRASTARSNSKVQLLADERVRTTVLKLMLDNDGWRRTLAEHLKLTRSEENVLFYDRVYELQTPCSLAEQHLKAKGIVEDFILPSGQTQVFLSEATTKRLVDLYNAGKWPELVLSFKPALDELFRDLKHSDAFAKFVATHMLLGNIVVDDVAAKPAAPVVGAGAGPGPAPSPPMTAPTPVAPALREDTAGEVLASGGPAVGGAAAAGPAASAGPAGRGSGTRESGAEDDPSSARFTL